MLNRIKEILQKTNDVYFIQIVCDKIVINHNYSGIIIFNNNLELEKEFYLFEDLIISSSYVNNNEILLYCGEVLKLVYINISNFECKIINISKDIGELTFSKVYEWINDKIILSSYNNQFFEVDLNKYTMKKISNCKTKKIYPEIYNFYKKYRLCSHAQHYIEIFKEQKIIIIYQKNKKILNFIKYNKNKYISNKLYIDININFYNIIYEKGILAAIDENIIEIITKKNKEKLILEEKFMYCGAKFFKKNNEMFIVVVITDKSCVDYSKLILYKILTD